MNEDVKFVRWPAEANMRTYWKKAGVPCLLIVEGGAEPPICTDWLEDWVRAPISRLDLQARVRALRYRVYRQKVPVLEETGTLVFGDRSLIMSHAQVGLMELFVDRFGEVVARQKLEHRLAERVPNPTRNSLDLHIMRLRRRLSSIDLVIRTAWGRGYLLDAQQPFARDHTG